MMFENNLASKTMSHFNYQKITELAIADGYFFVF
ncbi:hypothetical protein ABID30_001090 [Enterococcus rotai]